MGALSFFESELVGKMYTIVKISPSIFINDIRLINSVDFDLKRDVNSLLTYIKWRFVNHTDYIR